MLTGRTALTAFRFCSSLQFWSDPADQDIHPQSSWMESQSLLTVESSGKALNVMSKEMFCHGCWTKMPTPIRIHCTPARLHLAASSLPNSFCQQSPSPNFHPPLRETLPQVNQPCKNSFCWLRTLVGNQINYIKGQRKLQPLYSKFLQTQLSILQNLHEKQSAGSSDSSFWGVKHWILGRSGM